MPSGSANQKKTICIREASTNDDLAIAELSRELGYQTKSEEVAPRLKFLLGSQDHGVFVAEGSTGEVVGWIHVFTSHRLMLDSFADLGGLVVSEAIRRQGIGEQLLNAAEEWTRSNGLKTLRIRSRDTRVEAHRFYQSKNYEIQKSQVVLEKSFS